MTSEQLEKLRDLCEKGCTDSDIEDFCDEYKVSRKDAFNKIAEWTVPSCCKGCIYMNMFPDMPPCASCSRGKKDYYTTNK